MTNPISNNGIGPLTPAGPPTPGKPTAPAPGSDFASLVKQQLAQVDRLQDEADQTVQKMLTGQEGSMTEVFTAARKAEVAFSLLMEIRNKLVESYEQIQNMRV